jgi:sugar fermentation stimulation protein A
MVPDFGSSDCGCESHLFRFGEDPMKDRSFLDVLFYFRHGRALERRDW